MFLPVEPHRTEPRTGRGLTGEPGRPAPQAALLHPLPVEQPEAQLPDELLQFRSGGVDQLGPGSAQHGPVDPEGQPGGHGGHQGAGERDDPGAAEQNPLLSARHDDAIRTRTGTGFRSVRERGFCFWTEPGSDDSSSCLHGNEGSNYIPRDSTVLTRKLTDGYCLGDMTL